MPKMNCHPEEASGTKVINNPYVTLTLEEIKKLKKEGYQIFIDKSQIVKPYVPARRLFGNHPM